MGTLTTERMQYVEPNNVVSFSLRKSFSVDDIVNICKLTEQTSVRPYNRIHDPEFMAGFGKQPIVPAMAPSSFSMGAFHYVFENLGCVFSCIDGIISPDVALDIDFSYNKPRTDDEKLKGKVKSNSFTLTFSADDSILEPKDHSITNVGFDYKSSAEYAALIGIRNYNPNLVSQDMIYAIALVSKALFQILDNPSKALEEKLARMIDVEKVYPVYSSFKIFLPEELPRIVEDDLAFKIGLKERTIKNSKVSLILYTAEVSASQKGLIYSGTYNLMPVEEGDMLSMAKPLTRRNH